MTLRKYLIIKWTTLLVALLTIIMLWYLLPSTLIAVFDWNTVWIGAIWEWAEPRLPDEAAIPIAAVQDIYSSLVSMIGTLTSLLSDPSSTRAEAAARAALGEGWIVVVQIAIIFRLALLGLYWLIRRRKNREYDIHSQFAS